MTHIRSGQAPERVCSALRAAILDGELEAGLPLRQDELAARYGTSRIPVREALRQLEAEGLVDYNPRRGAVVSTISLTEALEMFDIRIALECRALNFAIPKMSEHDFSLLDGVCHDYDMCDPAGDILEWGRLNRVFHAALYAACERPRLIALINDNIDNATRFVRIQTSRAYGFERPRHEHRAILAACRTQDAKLAVRLLEEHITHAQKALGASVRHTARPKVDRAA